MGGQAKRPTICGREVGIGGGGCSDSGANGSERWAIIDNLGYMTGESW